jgi:hypothetical protein
MLPRGGALCTKQLTAPLLLSTVGKVSMKLDFYAPLRDAIGGISQRMVIACLTY